MGKSKMFFCLDLETGVNVVGLMQWVGVITGVTLFILNYDHVLESTRRPFELPIMLLVAYVLPAFFFLVHLLSPLTETKYTLAAGYFCCHFAVEIYAFVVPWIYLHQYIDDGANTQISASPLMARADAANDNKDFYFRGSITANSGYIYVGLQNELTGPTIRVRDYLILSSVICALFMILTLYVSAKLWEYAEEKRMLNMPRDQRERLVERSSVYLA